MATSSANAFFCLYWFSKCMFECEPPRDKLNPDTGIFANTHIGNQWCVDHPSLNEIIGMSYFFAYVSWDFVMMYRLGACSGKGDLMEFVHHTLAFVCSGSAIYVGKYTATMGVFTFIVEGSTPFYNIRKYLVTHDLGSGAVYLLNGLCGLVSFFLCRVVFNIYMVSQQLYPALVRDEWGVTDTLLV